MEDNVRDVLTDKDIEPLQTVQNPAPGSARNPGLSGPYSAIVNLLKTMHEQIMVSNQLLSGLVDKDQRLYSRKRKMSISDSDDDYIISSRSGKKGKSICKESETLSVAPHRRQTSLVDNSVSMLVCNAEPCSPKDNSHDLIDNISVNLLDSTDIHPRDDDDALSLFGDREIDPNDHRGNRKQDDHDTGESCLKGTTGTEDHDELMPSDVFLESIDSSTSMTVPKGPPILPKLATLVNDRFKTELETGQRKQIKAKYMVPENCTEIFWPPVNEHIWNPLKPDAKGVDRALVAMQDTLVVASGAIATSLHDLLLSRDNTKPLEHKAIATRLIDVITLLGSICKELSYRRKEALRPYLTADFKYACNRSTKPEKFLFGNDISKTIHEIKTMGKIVQNSPQRARGVSQFRASVQNVQSKPYGQSFLSQRGRTARPPRKPQGHYSSVQQIKKKPWHSWNK